MGKFKVFVKIAVAGSLFFIAMIGCANNPIIPGIRIEKHDADVAPGQYAVEIASLEKIVQQDPDSSNRMQAHLQLARLYASYKNPARNYQKALEHLEIYASLYPPIGDHQYLRDWLSTLKEIERLSGQLDAQKKIIAQVSAEFEKSRQECSVLKNEKTDLETANTSFRSANLSLKEKNAELKAHNLKLAKTIEMLKNLDRDVEEKRKNFNTQ